MSATVIFELLAVGLVGGISFTITQFVKVKRFDKNFSVQDTNNLIVAVPVACYLAYRLYFGLAERLVASVPAWPYLRKYVPFQKHY